VVPVSEPVVCSIGSTDPWNAAGLGLDIRALAACGARPVSVVAGVTAQDRSGVRAAAPIEPALIAAQLDALADAGVAAFRIGALLDAAGVKAVAAYVARVRVPVVYDPAFAPSGGGSLADDAAIAAARETLLPHVTLVTPNLAEAGRLCGVTPPADGDTMERAARSLVAQGAHAALVKGGHLAGAPRDVLVDADGVVSYEGVRLPLDLRGTGCLLACAVAVELARERPLREAVTSARAFVRERIANGRPFGGMRVAF